MLPVTRNIKQWITPFQWCSVKSCYFDRRQINSEVRSNTKNLWDILICPAPYRVDSTPLEIAMEKRDTVLAQKQVKTLWLKLWVKLTVHRWSNVLRVAMGMTVVAVELLSHVQFFSAPWTAAPGFPAHYLPVCSNSCPLSQWCYLTISSSVTHSFCLQSFPASESFSSELALWIRWPKQWQEEFSISYTHSFWGLLTPNPQGPVPTREVN